MSSLENNVRYSFNKAGAFDAPAYPTLVRTKIIATVGPASRDKATMREMIDAGLNVMRINFSHGTHEYHRGTIGMFREVLAESRRTCAVMLDTKGPEIRSGLLAGGREVALRAGQLFTFLCGERHARRLGDSECVYQTYDGLSRVLAPGSPLLVDDGLIAMRVERIEGGGDVDGGYDDGYDCARALPHGERVVCRVLNDAVLGERKGINLPGANVDLPALTQKDTDDLLFGIEQQVDFVAASFIRKPEDVAIIRKFLDANGGAHIHIISKIENQESLEKFDAILCASDGIMVARGDLGVEVRLELVSSAQKHIISKCNVQGKPVITATQMLESMVKNPRPTRAEASDVANAALDGSDAVMLSGETAKGAYPVHAVQTMASICREAERTIDHLALFTAIRAFTKTQPHTVTEAITSSAVKTAFDLEAKLILCLTETGRTARLICKYRPVCPVLAVTSNELCARQCLLLRHCHPLVVGSMVGTESLIARSLRTAKKNELVRKGDLVVLISGMREGVSGSTNLLRVITAE